MHFIDTNVLLDAFGSDKTSERTAIARGILAKGNVAFSIQVFQEFFLQATHSRRADPLTPVEAAEVIQALAVFPVQTNDLGVFQTAVEIQQRFQTSFRDANILAAARALKCDILYAEDLNDGQDYGGVTVVNPFHAP